MGEKVRKVIVDTYALMSKASGEITAKANEYLNNVRIGKVKGLIHPIIVYEFLLQVVRRRIPIFTSAEEALDFLESYFLTVKVENRLAMETAKMRVKSEKQLKQRRLSICDAFTIALAKSIKASIITGDKDLQAIAEQEGIKVIW